MSAPEVGTTEESERPGRSEMGTKDVTDGQSRKRGSGRLTAYSAWAFAIFGVLVGLYMIGQYAFYRFTRSMTNDAFVESHIVHLASQAGGLLTRVEVEEHGRVKAGQVLAETDPTPHRRELELAQAKREVAAAALRLEESTLERMVQEHPRKVALAEKDLSVADSALTQAERQLVLTTRNVEEEIHQAKSAVDSSRAALTKVREDYDRYKQLFEEKSAPERKFQDVTREFKMSQADFEAAESKLLKAEANRLQIEIASLGVAQKAREKEHASEQLRLAVLGELAIDEERRAVAQKRAQVAEAARVEQTILTGLQYTKVVAPFDGVVVRRYRNPGDHAPIGSPILSLYDPELVYVTAYMEEERLEGISPGNRARVWFDAISGSMDGRVVWIDRATGANFALLPRDVSSGEFTKVTQRVPIRIAIDRGEHWSELRPGLSATVAITHGPGDPAWAEKEAEWERSRASRGVSPIDPASSDRPGVLPRP
ncbi:HlyD family secretion protein [Tundrisphaera lichenicola]|uniref:HlyD family secretion protein n=1 Tax=Tundrisphaera lichenicola TaxID=2029860 RepID=UPI003EBA51AE